MAESWCFRFLFALWAQYLLLNVRALEFAELPPSHDLKVHNDVLSFVQLESEETVKARAEAETRVDVEYESMARNAPIYGVNVEVDLANIDTKHGVTISFDKKAHTLVMKPGINQGAGIAWGYMVDRMEQTGWIELYVQATSSGSVTNDVKIYAAGFLEGILTAARMSQFYANANAVMQRDGAAIGALKNVKKMFNQEIEFTKKRCNFHAGVLSRPPLDPYWHHARLILFQVWGIRDGYNFVAIGKGVVGFTLIDMWAINANGNMPEMMQMYTKEAMLSRREYQSKAMSLIEAFGHPKTRHLRREYNKQMSLAVSAAPHVISGTSPNMTAASDFIPPDQLRNPDDYEPRPKHPINHTTLMKIDREWEHKVQTDGRCSAFVRLTGENKDLLVGHTTWDDYSKMTRIFKYYKWKLKGAWTSVSHIGMSSYPGCVSSTDDFYMLDNGLVVTDTSMEILNPRIYDRVAEFPGNFHIPHWMHLMATNRMAKTAVHWTTLFSTQNNGQVSAQWMLINYNSFTPGSPLPDGSFFVLEQVPGTIQKADMSLHLRTNGYWASYNRPFFPSTRAETGHAAAAAHYGGLYSYGGNPRAVIFKNIGVNVENLFDMRSLMRRNEYPNEGVLPNEPGHAISARNDLDPTNRLPNGGIDAKVVNSCLFRNLQCQAVSGPTHDTQGVFMWAEPGGPDLIAGWPHIGLPDSWNFDWVQMTPSQMMLKIDDVNTC